MYTYTYNACIILVRGTNPPSILLYNLRFSFVFVYCLAYLGINKNLSRYKFVQKIYPLWLSLYYFVYLGRYESITLSPEWFYYLIWIGEYRITDNTIPINNILLMLLSWTLQLKGVWNNIVYICLVFYLYLFYLIPSLWLYYYLTDKLIISTFTFQFVQIFCYDLCVCIQSMLYLYVHYGISIHSLCWYLF